MNINHPMYSHFDKFGDGQTDCINCGGVLPITSAKQINFPSGVTWWPVCPPCVFDVLGADDSAWESDFTSLEFEVHPYNIAWVCTAQEQAILDYQDDYLVNDWDGPPMFHSFPEPRHWNQVQLKRNQAEYWLLANDPDDPWSYIEF